MIVQNTPPVFMQKVENDFCALWRKFALVFVHYGENIFSVLHRNKPKIL